ncbi:MAG: YesL family protein [Lachnospiraceae bacterium]|nr:YesL family protein [Lachnospiraceae bacterium]
MGGILNPNSKVMQEISKATDCIIVKFLFIIFSLPVVTAGAAFTAQYYVIMKIARGEDPVVFKSFWKSFKDNFKQSTVIWIINLLFIIFLGADWIIILRKDMNLTVGKILFAVFTLFIIIGFLCMYAFIARFTSSNMMVIRAGFLMAFLKFPAMVLMLIFMISPYVVGVWYIKYLPIIWVVMKLVEVLYSGKVFVSTFAKVEKGTIDKSEKESEGDAGEEQKDEEDNRDEDDKKSDEDSGSDEDSDDGK